MRCPHCHAATRLFKSDGDTVKMRAPIAIFRDGNCFVPCPKCKEEIQVPVELRESELSKDPKLVLAPRRLTPPKDNP